MIQAKQHLGELEELCNKAAAFLQTEADKIGSDSTNIEMDTIFAQSGLDLEAIETSIPDLEQRGEAFERFYHIMDSICSNYKAVEHVRPQPYPPIRLPQVDLTLY